ncbi:hypothetical protein E1211_05345 [Micromonospora sp. 15K316]|uniref:hypothetical protein n=1 Tax=Micromonospora sp. 15K316 TaxID=2530376 RepID=UPI00104D0B44|nr:hypothetical protein [Micromonospora sp. 15K316]TDC39091.1 hypothetical protein E1211_05345 [Micromonospora sp. 15K316]
MSEAGQPGAATPGEHGDGSGQQDPSRSTGGWAPPAAAWHASGEPGASGEPARWAPDPSTGWAASSPRHGDLPAPVAGLTGDAEPPARVNGHHANGVSYSPDEASASRRAPVSAPPVDEDRRDPGSERLVVPAQRPAPAAEQAYGPTEPEPGPARHGSEEPPVTRPRWTEPGLPTSAPPAVQVPPVGTAPSGFEVPPGFQAPTVDASTDERQADQHGWADGYPTAAEPGPAQSWAPAEPPAGEPDWSGPSWNRPSWGSAWAPSWSRQDEEPARRRAREGDEAAGEAEPPSGHLSAGPGEPVGRRGREDDESVGRRPSGPAAPTGHLDRELDEPVPRQEAAARQGHEADGPGGRRARGQNAPAWAAEQHRPYEPVRMEPSRPSEAVPGEPSHPYDATSETGHSAEADRPAWAAEHRPPAPAAAPPQEPTSTPAERPAWAAERRVPGSEPSGSPATPERPGWAAGSEATSPPSATPERPAWAAGSEATSPPPGAPTGAPPVAPAGPPSGPAAAGRPAWAGGSGEPAPDRPSWAATRPTSVPPVVREASPADRPEPTPRRAAEAFRRRPVDADAANRTAPESPTAGRHVPDPTPGVTRDAQVPTGPAASATSGAGRHDHAPATPAPAGAPGYAARRSAPDPVPTADQSVGRRPDPTSAVLPQRVPAEPDVPVVPEPPAVEPPAETPQLARIATHLRRDDEPAAPQERPEGFDVNAILGAVREVAGVRDASLRRTPAGAHSLRLDLADGADPAEVSRQVARLLQERMGLAAAPQNVPGLPAAPPTPVRRRKAVRDPEPAQSAGAAREVREDRPAGTEAGAAGEAPGRPSRSEPEPPRRRRPPGPQRGRATVDEALSGAATGSPVNLGASYSGAQLTTTESGPSRPLDTGGVPGPRVVIDHVQVSTFGLDANVEVRLVAAGETAAGYATGPAVDGYVLRLCGVAAAAAVDELLRRPARAEGGRCFVEHAAVVPFGNCEVATVVVLLVCDGWVEQLAGSALVAGDPRQAVVRATLAAVNRRLEALLA